MLTAEWPYASRIPTVQIRCGCCWTARQVMATVIDQRLVVMRVRPTDRVRHWRALDMATLASLPDGTPVVCECCPTEQGLVFGEWVDGMLMLRSRRLRVVHFVVLPLEQLHQLLALAQIERKQEQYIFDKGRLYRGEEHALAFSAAGKYSHGKHFR
jgi:hypothetical protein